jgi:hypothetical protein
MRWVPAKKNRPVIVLCCGKRRCSDFPLDARNITGNASITTYPKSENTLPPRSSPISKKKVYEAILPDALTNSLFKCNVENYKNLLGSSNYPT